MTDPIEKFEVNEIEHEAEDARDWSRYGADDASVEAYKEIVSWSSERFTVEDRKFARRLDFVIGLPILVLYIMNYLDRNSIAQARISGLIKDTHITQEQYALVNGIFYISYIFSQTPANMIISKTRPSVFIPAAVILWAIISSLTAVCSSLGHLVAVRFMLGIVKGPFYPGAVFYLSCWYTRKEIGKRCALLVSGICLSNAIAGLITTGILEGLSGAQGIAGWKWIFTVEGSITVFLGIAAFFILPDYPSTTTRFSAHDRIFAQYRMDRDFGEGTMVMKDVTAMHGLRMAVKDVRTWIFGFLQASVTITISFNFFYPTLIQGLGFKGKTTILLLTVPPYILAFLTSVGMAWSADRSQKRALHYLICIGTAAIGLVMLTALAKFDQPGAKYFATFVLAAGSFAAYACSYPWLASIVPHPPAKRAVMVGIANSLSNVGAFVSGYIYYAPLGPTYLVSWTIALAFCFFIALAVWSMWHLVGKRNLHLDEVEEKYRQGLITEAHLESMEADEQLAAQTGFRLVR